ncbi:MAG: sugar phosphate isomerase/epimerase [Prevotellaceae bacterium]|jgi:sugar phosphate isomerase/epimerase|nr:sugar phosphate isomerase/epimerase [Prevotellaceae bacterium]
MAMDRRKFIRTTALSTGLAVAGGLASASCGLQGKKDASAAAGSSKAKDVKLNISFQENTAPGESLSEKFDFMEKLGVTGFEPWGGGLYDRVTSIQDALKGRNIKISAVCAGFEGWLLADDDAIKQKCIDSSKRIIEAAGALGAAGMILVPAFNSQKSWPHTLETRERLVNELRELAQFAEQHKTSLILEPLNRREAFYLRLVSDAAAICKDVDSKGIACMGDFWHMTWEETSDYGAFLSGGKYLNHVHIASRKRRRMPGEDGEADNYIDGFNALKAMDYQGFISFECGTEEDRNVVVPAAVDLIKKQWEMDC